MSCKGIVAWNRFNERIKTIMVTQIILGKDVDNRALLIAFLIYTSILLFRIGNLNGLRNLIAALDHVVVRNLKDSWNNMKRLRPNLHAVYIDLWYLFTDHNDWYYYRKIISSITSGKNQIVFRQNRTAIKKQPAKNKYLHQNKFTELKTPEGNTELNFQGVNKHDFIYPKSFKKEHKYVKEAITELGLCKLKSRGIDRKSDPELWNFLKTAPILTEWQLWTSYLSIK
ncbi:hypothetical protein GJ496_005100 [Pomphorhynchus laevis]|nr:hypothetical protein GJ496_005100 [Pomphorhynchus laevis]